jgi:hypothetical protein
MKQDLKLNKQYGIFGLEYTVATNLLMMTMLTFRVLIYFTGKGKQIL